MIINCVCSRIRSIFLAFINVFKRALCILHRRRPSDTQFVQLDSINVVQSSQNVVQKYDDRGRLIEKDWNSWDDSPQTVDEHIQRYREQLVRPPTPPVQVEEPDFFQDMAPQVIPQQRLLINTGTTPGQPNSGFSRLQADSDIPVMNELKDWEELEGQGWEEVDDETTKRLIREKKKELRHQKHYQQQSQHSPQQNHYRPQQYAGYDYRS